MPTPSAVPPSAYECETIPGLRTYPSLYGATPGKATVGTNSLVARRLLDETLVVIGGEFSRTPMGQGSGTGVEPARPVTAILA
jgi:hypothetical protein